MRDRASLRLLHAPYKPPALRVGDRAICLYRDCVVVITSWSDARLSWPRCRELGTQGGGHGLLVNEELRRAIRSESSIALQHWLGVNAVTVWRWRLAFGVAQWGTEGSRRLHRQLSEAGAKKLRGRKLSTPEVERRRQTALRLGLRPGERWGERGWTREQLAMLGTASDAHVAAKIGRTETAVRVMRSRVGIANRFDRRRAEHKRV
jgi:hypothetical protein